MWFVLPCTGVLVVGVTSFREREQVPSLLSGGGGFDRFDSDCYSIRFFSPRSGPSLSLFIASKKMTRVTFAVKG
jgi:hypothetical protein